ncbi:glycoside hydrolase family 13 protein [Arthrobacter cupressi]|uniref:Alpha-glucosidase n=1 Tax=Arthrobacter cupressi TaxID=1045773 RepID=A0A1G8HR04_9MICC|nr:glycoside hydrolase family 13 protein [Arthrobacter cupressi]NYD78784.1 alpha-glucosidase [Arthrobacter cupressi]SDI09106.1 alpha-glucosidase [Arthrobacter cupressi]
MSSISIAASPAAATAAEHPALGPLTHVHAADSDDSWWRSAVIYQIYPRSFRDASGDGVGDLPGITAELHHIAELGADAVWLSPFYASPQRDGGYDVADYCAVDPLFGTLEDFDHLSARARDLGLRVIVDLVPNHCSSEHRLFQAALAAAPGSPEREYFIFRDGRGDSGELPPNNWQSHFGGSAWTRITEAGGSPGQWYLHLFDSSQPDFNWDNPAVATEFERVLRFWLDRGVAGFRVDVAHALVKAPGLPDWGGRADGGSSDGFPSHEAPMFGQPALHDVYSRWREVLAEYGDDRILCAEANVDPIERMAAWVAPGQQHQAFNFPFLASPFAAEPLRAVVSRSLAAFDAVGAPTTWVLSNHDVVRHASRLGMADPGQGLGDGIGPDDPQPDTALGRRRARAASLFMLALPGSSYLYQGEELGLPDNTAIPAERRQDPTFHRTGGARVGRDGCRVPLPWRAGEAAHGFSPNGMSWLPQPRDWDELARDVQAADPASHLSVYRRALELRREFGLGTGSLAWAESWCRHGALAFVNGTILVMLNLGDEYLELPDLDILLSSQRRDGRVLAPGEAAWLSLEPQA